MTIEEMIRRKRELGYTYERISEESGVPLGTVQKIFGGITKSPRYDTIRAIEKVLQEAYRPKDPLYSLFSERWEGYPSQRDLKKIMGEYYVPPEKRIPPTGSYPIDVEYSTAAEWGLVRESLPIYGHEEEPPYRDSYPLLPYKRQGEYTIHDRDLLPETIRTELIDGVIYDLASPTTAHQVVVAKLFLLIQECITKHKVPIMAFLSPTDVFLDRNDKTATVPDLFVVEDLQSIGQKGIAGAPPFVLEILSPSTRSKDILRKTWKYGHSGAKEYWIVDHKKKWIRAYDFEKDPEGEEYKEYTFADKVPLAISGGKCKIDFKRVEAELAKLPNLYGDASSAEKTNGKPKEAKPKEAKAKATKATATKTKATETTKAKSAKRKQDNKRGK